MTMHLFTAFEWDDDKAAANLAKHGVSFPYAARVFMDRDAADIDASRNADGEARRKRIGMIEGKVYVAVYTARDGTARIISARRANVSETRAYAAIQN